jgi:hypothetical protein
VSEINVDAPVQLKKASMAAALCYGVRGGGAQLCFHVRAASYDTDSLIEVLGRLRRFLGGEKATLLWDRLPSHRSTAMRDWIRSQRSWLVVEQLPRLRTRPQPGRGPVVEPQGRRPGRGDRPGPTAASTASAAPRTWPIHSCATPPIGLMTINLTSKNP